MSQAELEIILADIERVGLVVDLTHEATGARAIDIAVAGILQGMDQEREPDGTPWEPLSEAYAEEKARIAPGAPMAVLHGLMKSEAEIRGTSRVEENRVVLEYGTGEATRAEATWFQEGDGNRPARPFYGLSPETIARLDDHFAARLDSALGGP